MPNYKIADLCIKINPLYERTKQRLAPYLTDSDDIDFEISVSENEIYERISKSEIQYSKSEHESTLILTKLCHKLLENYNGLFFHSSSLMLDGEGYVFTAPSGTGKSTHTALWRKHFGERITMINDDKPLIRQSGENFFIYGTPWMGKSNIGNNVKAKVKAVFVLKRGKQNSVKRVSISEVFKEILEATIVPKEKAMMSNLLSLLDKFFTKVPIYLLYCDISDEAVLTAYNAANTQNSL
ncbi:MAG: hypothetical protein J1E85_07830 [Ruminococcus sp.]|nr:hypothetical protein [Ruminococcus sp.]